MELLVVQLVVQVDGLIGGATSSVFNWAVEGLIGGATIRFVRL